MSNLETVKKYALGVMQDVAIRLAKHAKDPHSTMADGDLIAEDAIARMQTATTMLQLAKRNAAVRIVKTEPRPVAAAAQERPMTTTKNAPRTLREAGDQELEAIAQEIVKRDRIDLVHARVKAQGTEAGRAALAKYYSPLRDEPIADAVQKNAHYAKFGKPGDALADAAHAIAARDGIGYVDALRKAEEQYPDLAQLYRGGDRW